MSEGAANGPEAAAALVAKELGRCPPADRPEFLRAVMQHAAAGLVVIQGHQTAAEAAYRLADDIVSRGSPDDK